MEKRISYAGIGLAVAGVIGLVGVYSAWWESDLATFNGTEDISGRLGLAMSIGMFAFGVAYVVIADVQIRRAMGALATLCAVLLTIACVWALVRADDLGAGVEASTGLFVSALGGVLGIAAGFLVLRDNMRTDVDLAGEEG